MMDISRRIARLRADFIIATGVVPMRLVLSSHDARELCDYLSTTGPVVAGDKFMGMEIDFRDPVTYVCGEPRIVLR